MGFILYIVAFLLFIPLTFLNIICVLWKYAKVGSFWKTLGKYFFQGAIDIDVFGNHNFRTLFNAILRKPGGYPFGIEEETISSVLGKNQKDGTLSFIGVGVAFVLDCLDKNHCKKSIKLIVNTK